MRRIKHSFQSLHCTDRTLATGFAVLVTLALHLVIAVPLLVRPGHSRLQRSSPDSRLVFGGLLAPAETVRRDQSTPRWVATPPPSLAGIYDLPVPTPVEVADEAADTALPAPDFVRRIGIITARIQSAWSLPGVRPSRDFHCRVRLREDEGGGVREIELWQCDDDPELRESLLKAIHAAAPLPPLAGDHQPAHDLILDFAAYASLSAGRRSSVEPSASMP
jgi:hypothetical protein